MRIVKLYNFKNFYFSKLLFRLSALWQFFFKTNYNEKFEHLHMM